MSVKTVGPERPYRETDIMVWARARLVTPRRTWWRKAACWLLGMFPFTFELFQNDGHAWRKVDSARVCMRCGAVRIVRFP